MSVLDTALGVFSPVVEVVRGIQQLPAPKQQRAIRGYPTTTNSPPHEGGVGVVVRTILWERLQDESLKHAVAHYRDHHDLWSSIVEDYTRCSLTREDDKLVCVVGGCAEDQATSH
jgi:hypothetical protein